MEAGLQSSHSSNWTATRRLLKFAWRYRSRVVSLLILQTILLGTAILAIQLSGFALDWIKSAGEPSDNLPTIYGWHPVVGHSPTIQVASIAGLIAAVALIRAALNYVYSVTNGKFINEEMVVDLRIAVYEKLQLLGFDFYNQNDTSGLVNRLTGDIQLTRSFVDGVIIQVSVLAMSLVFYLTAMLRLHVGLTLVSLATTPLLIIQTHRFSKKIRPQYDRNRELFDEMMLRVNENAEGQQAIKAFGAQEREIEKFRVATERVEKQQRSIFWKVSTFTPTVQLLTQFNLIVLLLYGGYLVINDQLPLGSGLIVFAGLIQQFSGQITALSGITNTIEQSLAGARRVFDVLDAPVRISSPSAASGRSPQQSQIHGAFELQDVDFSYRKGDEVLRQINLSIEPCSRVGIIGEIGCGKSTLLQLLPRFYDPTQGRILLDGVDLQEYDLIHLRRSIGFVFQDPFLFSDSVAANIAFGDPNATMDKIVAAAKSAAVDHFIRTLPNGYNTVLGQFGLTLSGGQRQRVALARALLFDPPVLILDDPTSAVDPGTEHEIWEALDRAFAQRTSLLVTNRISTLSYVDRVIVMENGQVTGDGTQNQLAQQATGFYAATAKLQQQLM